MNPRLALKNGTHIHSYIFVRANFFNSGCRYNPMGNADFRYNPMDSFVPLDIHSYTSLLQACISIKQLNTLHANILINGLDQNVILGTKLVNMYGVCGSVANARQVFDKTSKLNVFLWNAIIKCYAWNGPCEDALMLFYQMQQTGINPDKFTFPLVLKACARLSALEQGNDIHDQIIRSGLGSDIYVGNALVDMYAKCGCIETARHVFDEMPERDVVSWSVMISGYVENGYPNEGLTLFNQMQLAKVKPNRVSILSVLPACAELSALQQGEDIHDYIVRNDVDFDDSVKTALLDMYAKCGNFKLAHELFDKMFKRDVVSWSAMIAGYAQAGNTDKALTLFQQMRLEDVIPNSITMVSVLSACAHLAALRQGKYVHAFISKCGFESEVSVGNALIDMYAKCECIDVAWQLFKNMSEKNVVSWNTMMAGCLHNGHSNVTLTLFHQMQLANVKPDRITMLSALRACAELGALQQGKNIHNYIVKNSFMSEVSVETALVAMYAKSGRVDIARQLFDKMPERDAFSWNTMIGGYGMHGYGEKAIALFNQMQQAGMKPDHITFICVLSACSHTGMVHEGKQYFDCMSPIYGIIPRAEHYACIVDLLGRAGHLDEAYDFITNMPLEPDANVLGTLLGACRNHCNLELGESVSKRLLELEPKDAGNYVLISNIYAAAGKWDDVGKVRTLLKDRGLKKIPGCSGIEIKNRVHIFVFGDRLHPQSEGIYAVLESMSGQMEETGMEEAGYL